MSRWGLGPRWPGLCRRGQWQLPGGELPAGGVRVVSGLARVVTRKLRLPIDSPDGETYIDGVAIQYQTETGRTNGRGAMEQEAMFEVSYHGSIVLVAPLCPEAKEWIDEHVQPKSWQWFGGALAVEPRYADDLIAAMASDLEST